MTRSCLDRRTGWSGCFALGARLILSIVALSVGTPRRVAAAPTTPPQPPFTECPAVGFDTSCGLLIWLTDDGAFVLGDPTQGPFDGGDDTLIGVRNDSHDSISSLPLVSTETANPIFAFDGDGLCGVTPHPDDCPFGSTGYEGPGTAFEQIAPDQTSGVVVFDPPLDRGDRAFFSLEAALTTTPPNSVGFDACPVTTTNRLAPSDFASPGLNIRLDQSFLSALALKLDHVLPDRLAKATSSDFKLNHISLEPLNLVAVEGGAIGLELAADELDVRASMKGCHVHLTASHASFSALLRVMGGLDGLHVDVAMPDIAFDDLHIGKSFACHLYSGLRLVDLSTKAVSAKISDEVVGLLQDDFFANAIPLQTMFTFGEQPKPPPFVGNFPNSGVKLRADARVRTVESTLLADLSIGLCTHSEFLHPLHLWGCPSFFPSATCDDFQPSARGSLNIPGPLPSLGLFTPSGEPYDAGVAISASAINQLLEAIVEAGGLNREIDVKDILCQQKDHQCVCDKGCLALIDHVTDSLGLDAAQSLVLRVVGNTAPSLTGTTVPIHGKPLSQFHVANLYVAFANPTTPDRKEPLAYLADFDGTIDLEKSSSTEEIQLTVMEEGTTILRLQRGTAANDDMVRPGLLFGIPLALRKVLSHPIKPFSLDFASQRATFDLMDTAHGATGVAVYFRVHFAD